MIRMTAAGDTSVAAVIVTYNRSELLEQCLQSLESQTLRPDLVIVVDNASDDGTGEGLSQRDWTIPHRVVTMGRNYGGAMGFAVGMRAAAMAGADAVWLMDDDAIALPEALEYLTEDMKVASQAGSQPAFACSLVTWRDGSAARMNIPRANAQWDLSTARLQRPVIDVDSASFVSCLIPMDHARAVGLPYVGYFKWYDDTEYTLRLRRTFGPGICSLRSVVRHLPEHNQGALPWMATDHDTVHHARALRNRLSASLELQDVRGLLAVTRDVGVAVTTSAVSPRNRLHLLRGYLSGFTYRPKPQPVDPDAR